MLHVRHALKNNFMSFYESSLKVTAYNLICRRQEFLSFNFSICVFLAACFRVRVLFSGFSRLHLVPLCSFANRFRLLLQFCFNLPDFA